MTPNICPPRRPDRNAYVERFHRSYKEECLQIHRPGTLEDVREITEQYLQHYNYERPHQGRSCGNRPPREAFPVLPTRPALPEKVDPDRWLEAINGQAFVRKVGADGCIIVDHDSYYVSGRIAGHSVALFVNAQERVFEIFHHVLGNKRLAIKRVIGAEMTFEAYLNTMLLEARSEVRQAQIKQQRCRYLQT